MEKRIQIGFGKSALIAAVSTLVFTCLHTAAWCGCSPMQIAEFAAAGYTRAQIDEVCDYWAPKENSDVRQTYRAGYHCSTPYGWCPMDAPAPVGSACACYTVYGAVEGMVVE